MAKKRSKKVKKSTRAVKRAPAKKATHRAAAPTGASVAPASPLQAALARRRAAVHAQLSRA